MDLLTHDLVRTTKITRVIQESNNIRTLAFEDEISRSALPGQFAMIWLPDVGEFPMSISLSYGKNESSIVVKAMGVGSKALYESHKGTTIGVRGPYGVPFTLPEHSKRVLLVGGGTGMAPIIAQATFLSKSRINAEMIIGSRSRRELAFLNTAKKILGSDHVYPVTDDGTLGFKGFAHEKVRELLEERKYDLIYSCGPEQMMYEIYRLARKMRIPVQFSLERIMKCGISICGSCSIGDLVLCRDGPVFNDEKLSRVRNEFGLMARDKTGKLVRR